jgi:hypothetical protein
LNAHCERFIRSIKEKTLDWIILMGEASLHYTLNQYLSHYHAERNHQGLENQLIAPEPEVGEQTGQVRRRERLGGFLSYYYREGSMRLTSIAYQRHEMSIVDDIRTKVDNDDFEFSQHATDQIIVRHISVQEVREAISTSEMIEDYPDDKYGPSCLLLGFTSSNRPLHIQCSYPSRPLVKIITLYEPDPARWVNSRTRRRNDDE